MFKTTNSRGNRDNSSSRSRGGDRGKKSFEKRANTFSSGRPTFRKDADYKNKENFSKSRSTERGGERKSNFKSDSPSKSRSLETKSFGGGSRSFHGNRSSGGFSSAGRFSSARSGGRNFGGSRGGGRSGGRKNSVFNDITKFINKSNTKEVRAVEEVYIPENSFEILNIDARLKKTILESGYSNPTLIQDKSIPSILEGRDLVGIANTGTGKTAAFLIPLIDKVLKNKREMVIILAPTRELAVQIDSEFKKFAKGLKVWGVLAVGGMPIYNQIKDFKYDHNFVVGTPGRIKDLIDRGVLDIKEFETIVLDESDRMLDMGFVDDMKFLMKEMPKVHQTLFFSATVSGEVNKIIKDFLVDPVSISVKTRDTAELVDQDVIRVHGKEKLNVLHELLLEKEFDKVIIFVKTKIGVDRLQKHLKELGHSVIAIHGDKRPRERNFAIKSFKDNHSTVLIATDVAARGLDIPNVSHVINYDLPSTYEDYIHRIGRTGRAGKVGKALTFVE
ncbi:MAG: hypothetical protein RI945_356 [Candidatus Parcubacteria bacterium]|jgi:superfamily II DNA/RNA helicase